MFKLMQQRLFLRIETYFRVNEACLQQFLNLDFITFQSCKFKNKKSFFFHKMVF